MTPSFPENIQFFLGTARTFQKLPTFLAIYFALFGLFWAQYYVLFVSELTFSHFWKNNPKWNISVMKFQIFLVPRFLWKSGLWGEASEHPPNRSHKISYAIGDRVKDQIKVFQLIWFMILKISSLSSLCQLKNWLWKLYIGSLAKGQNVSKFDRLVYYVKFWHILTNIS